MFRKTQSYLKYDYILFIYLLFVVRSVITMAFAVIASEIKSIDNTLSTPVTKLDIP